MAEQAHEVGELSNEAKQSVAHGMQTIDQATRVMDGTIGQMGQAVERIDQLKETSREIEELLGVIRKISDQTNLLALNATIEAARAGDAGKGFAVVAGEVKDLSRQTAMAAESIGQKSAAIQGAVTSVVQSIGDISGNVRQAAESLSASQDSMRTIDGNMQNVDGRVHEIRFASQDQATAAGEIAQGVATISTTSEELDQMAQLALDGTDKLERMLGNDLKKLSAFKINQAIIELAKTDHLMWKKRLIDMVLGRGQIALDEVTDHRQCRLGKWYTADGQRAFGHAAAFTELDGPHAEVHKLAKRAVEQFHKGEHEAAIRTVEAIGPLSDEVIRLLDALAV
jgi:methyl-accepting chemotaxis protein